MGIEEEMRLIDLITEDLHHALEMLKSDARSLASNERPSVGTIELKPGWEEQLPKLIHRYEKQINSIYNSYDDPEGNDELQWINAHYAATMNFLLKHNLARKTNGDV